MKNTVDKRVNELWHHVVESCNKILTHAEYYGFQLMDIPDPNVKSIAKTFDTIVIPLLDDLVRDYNFSPESGIKIANIKTYALRLREITIAIDNNDEDSFNRNVDLLTSEAMIF